jgi:hypothetical protein
MGYAGFAWKWTASGIKGRYTMTMTADMVLFVLGALLLLTGILGGGFEVRELKIPQIKGGARMLASVAGLGLIVMGLQMQKNDPNSLSIGRDEPVSRNLSMTSFRIRDRLGENQVSEQVRILVDGRDVGTISVNEHYPLAMITATVPRDGQHSYVLEARAVFNVNGDLREIVGVGQGMINVSTGKEFELMSSFSGNTWLAHMEEISR